MLAKATKPRYTLCSIKHEFFLQHFTNGISAEMNVMKTRLTPGMARIKVIIIGGAVATIKGLESDGDVEEV